MLVFFTKKKVHKVDVRSKCSRLLLNHSIWTFSFRPL